MVKLAAKSIHKVFLLLSHLGGRQISHCLYFFALSRGHLTKVFVKAANLVSQVLFGASYSGKYFLSHLVAFLFLSQQIHFLFLQFARVRHQLLLHAFLDPVGGFDGLFNLFEVVPKACISFCLRSLHHFAVCCLLLIHFVYQVCQVRVFLVQILHFLLQTSQRSIVVSQPPVFVTKQNHLVKQVLKAYERVKAGSQG